jgi:hypothetical protein
MRLKCPLCTLWQSAASTVYIYNKAKKKKNYDAFDKVKIVVERWLIEE